MTSKELLEGLSLVLGPSGVAWATIRFALNGTRATLTRLESKVDRVAEAQSQLSIDVARLQTAEGIRAAREQAHA